MHRIYFDSDVLKTKAFLVVLMYAQYFSTYFDHKLIIYIYIYIYISQHRMSMVQCRIDRDLCTRYVSAMLTLMTTT